MAKPLHAGSQAMVADSCCRWVPVPVSSWLLPAGWASAAVAGGAEACCWRAAATVWRRRAAGQPALLLTASAAARRARPAMALGSAILQLVAATVL
jgi:hypothetical protein